MTDSSSSEHFANSDAHLIDATVRWVDDIVIKHNFCPFAKYVRNPNRIKYVVESGDAGDIVEALFTQAKLLDESSEIATTLIILGASFVADFDEYLDILAISERMLHEWGYDGVYQLASFHPHYVFEGNTEKDAENYTNRSPYPVLHLIREDDISRYMKNEEDAEKIFQHNIDNAEALGCPYFESKLAEFKKNRPES